MLNCCIERKRARESNKEESEAVDNLREPLDKTVSTNDTSQPTLNETKDQPNKLARSKSANSSRKNSEKAVEAESSVVDTVRKSVSSNKSNDDVSDDDEFYECESGTSDHESVDDVPSPPSKMLRSDEPEADDDVTHESGDHSKDMDQSSVGDCDQNASKPDITDPTTLQSPTPSDSSFLDVYDHQPEGRSHRCGELRLLSNEREYVYVPCTQDTAPMTEDMLEEHAEVLARYVCFVNTPIDSIPFQSTNLNFLCFCTRLGTSEEGMQLRARMQSASLFSDMQSFKAANPGATLADFVRWYSPRDWVEADEHDHEGKVAVKGEEKLMHGPIFSMRYYYCLFYGV